MADAVDPAKPRLNPDIYRHIVSILTTPDKLTVACVCSRLRELCEASLSSSPLTLNVHGSALSGKQLLWIAKERLRGECVRLDVSRCEALTKANIATVLTACPSLTQMAAIGVGPGSWSAKHIERLLAAAPPRAAILRLDARLELKNDCDEDSSLLSAFADGKVQLERLTLVADNVTAAVLRADEADGPASATAVDAAAAALAHVDITDRVGAAANDEQYDEPPSDEQAASLGRLSAALQAQQGSLIELDASSGALGVPGAAVIVLAPLLSADGCRLRVLMACNLTRGVMPHLAPSLSANRSISVLELNSNLIYGAAIHQLAQALDGHPALTRLSLEHNPILDGGGAALASSLLLSTRLTYLSLRFTGVADGTCDAIARALAPPTPGEARGRSSLTHLVLAGNRISTAGVSAIAASGLGALRTLDLNANLLLSGEATIEVAKALPASRVRTLSLAGCKVDKKACAKLASALPRSVVTNLDLSCNHFQSSGSDEIAFILNECEALRVLSLADCDLDDDAADELLDGLSADKDDDDDGDGSDGTPGTQRPTPLVSLDLRWNRLQDKHLMGRGISADARVDVGSQKQQSAADRQTAHLEATFAQAKAAGKKVYVPKWAREQQKMKKGGGGAGTGSAVG